MLHGLGDTGSGWSSVAPELALPHVKWVFPTAPTRPISVNGGMAMPGWFDIENLSVERFSAMMAGGAGGFDRAGTAESVAYVSGLVDAEVAAGVPPARVVVGGFSQGGHVALKAALARAPRLAGCAALSTWMEPPAAGDAPLPPEHAALPVFYGHGAADPLIPPQVATATLAGLRERLGMTDVVFKLYPGLPHSANAEEMADLKAWLQRVLPAEAPTPAAVKAMSARELKALLGARGVPTAGLLEKAELVEAALNSLL
jgi:lysophospholipase-1